MRTPSLKAIKTFQIAAKHSSFAVAADELCITPSAVSHQIKTLETQLGLPLFSRGARALALTDAGARYLEQIDDLFMRLDAVTEQLRARFGRSHAAEADISVVVGSGPWNNGLVAHPLFAQALVPAASPRLLAERPVSDY